ncbi:hypothetical protein DPMN_039304 [Dreissena polymorpha]|uniref:Uncharacterized protein n=1 Tax=Dreissena polymorpha TaxID=45954 RepID=A0A9D4BD80_DREPO|nr:hypothetical protein DPMN_192503 [Dreissena polymorpha]KAH3698346.1 hypothetical protein DPMN_085865 [Dreissena polymorpha]KAH3709383.1 hypothetical protein DPMN_068845 [Dreissena polymorpha]KAH3716985.1 hypothetical protein DPMN_059721 [Dreissena polymorpha]KAH3729268.1 hypothetical protein DPMN_055235 [Dreissena polymorpha]
MTKYVFTKLVPRCLLAPLCSTTFDRRKTGFQSTTSHGVPQEFLRSMTYFVGTTKQF